MINQYSVQRRFQILFLFLHAGRLVLVLDQFLCRYDRSGVAVSSVHMLPICRIETLFDGLYSIFHDGMNLFLLLLLAIMSIVQ